MAWPKGVPRLAHVGRQKGTPNRKTRTVEETCAKYNFDPIEAMINIYMTTQDESLKLSAAKEVAQYILPKRKALEVSTTSDEGFRVIVEDYRKKDA